MRRSPINRTTPLVRRTPLRDWTALDRQPTRTRRPANRGPVVRDIDAIVCERDGWCCVRCGLNVSGGERGRDYSIQHRRPRGIGGSRRPETEGPQNKILLCGDGTTGCHGWVESNRGLALYHGWLVSQWEDPATVRVLVDRGERWVYLTASGEYADNPPEVAA